MARLQNLLRGLSPLNITSAEDLREFHLFPKLPLEIRREIWRLAAMQPRYILLFARCMAWRQSGFTNQTRHPAILETCQEARREGRRYYHPHFEKCPADMISAEQLKEWGPHKYNRNLLHINFAVDKFVFNAEGDRLGGKNYAVSTFNFELDTIQSIENLLLGRETLCEPWVASMKSLILGAKPEIITMETRLWAYPGDGEHYYRHLFLELERKMQVAQLKSGWKTSTGAQGEAEWNSYVDGLQIGFEYDGINLEDLGPCSTDDVVRKRSEEMKPVFGTRPPCCLCYTSTTFPHSDPSWLSPNSNLVST